MMESTPTARGKQVRRPTPSYLRGEALAELAANDGRVHLLRLALGARDEVQLEREHGKQELVRGRAEGRRRHQVARGHADALALHGVEGQAPRLHPGVRFDEQHATCAANTRLR
jgi:hypothetical protein